MVNFDPLVIDLHFDKDFIELLLVDEEFVCK